ncbi:MAG: hypothetical protein COA47_01900 [Robiginitomaculum sp.]|nr:MAG: hypothetical protein COA47_01900 [Robiginitomaculum sp.]
MSASLNGYTTCLNKHLSNLKPRPQVANFSISTGQERMVQTGNNLFKFPEPLLMSEQIMTLTHGNCATK